MRRFERGERVRHQYLGNGTHLYTLGFASLVMWDIVPKVGEHVGINPTMIYTSELRHEDVPEVKEEVNHA